MQILLCIENKRKASAISPKTALARLPYRSGSICKGKINFQHDVPSESSFLLFVRMILEKQGKDDLYAVPTYKAGIVMTMVFSPLRIPAITFALKLLVFIGLDSSLHRLVCMHWPVAPDLHLSPINWKSLGHCWPRRGSQARYLCQ